MILGPFRQYWQGLSRWNRPDDLVDFIRTQQPMPADLIQYVLVTTGVTALVARLIGYKEGSLEFVNVPIVNEVIIVAVYLAGGLISAVVYHLPLRLAGGQGTFRQSWLALTYVAVTFLPFIVLAEGLYVRIAHSQLPRSAYTGAQLVYGAVLLGKIHGISHKRATVVLCSVTFALLALGIGVVVLWG